MQCSAEVSANLLSTALFLSHNPLFWGVGCAFAKRHCKNFVSYLIHLSCLSSPHYSDNSSWTDIHRMCFWAVVLKFVDEFNFGGHRVAQLFETLRYKPEVRGFDSWWCHWNFSLTSFRPHCGPVVDSASNRNEYQEYFLGGKSGRCVGLTTLPSL